MKKKYIIWENFLFLSFFMENFEIFYFEWFDFDKNSWEASFFYSFDKKEFFTEKIYFYDLNFDIKRKNQDIKEYEVFLFPLSLALWVSYYKLFPTKKLIVETWFLNETQKEFWKNFYTQWLGEFFYRNQLDYKEFCNFEINISKKIEKIENIGFWNYSLLPIWWGKDSIVSSEILEKNNISYTPFIFWKRDFVKDNQLKILWKEALFIKRELSLNLFKLTNQGYYNWHIPISGIISFVSLFVVYLYDYKNIIFSNEKSANIWNTFLWDLEVNHQYSKSIDFESKLRDYIKNYISEEIEYFSLLRGWYELKIASLFVKFWKKYFSSFSSCNANFKINQDKKNKNLWCKSCPKCVFVYSILRPFLTDEENMQIFWEELYQKEDLKDIFLEIWWWKNFKPFECVWEEEEVRLATYLFLQKKPNFKANILEIFKEKITKIWVKSFQNLQKKYFSFDENNFSWEEFKTILRNI